MKIYLCLSKFGDLMNLAPLWYADFQKTGERQKVLVSAEFSSVLRGMSYVEYIEYPGPTYEVQKAYDFAKTLGGEVICTMTNGPREQVQACTYRPHGKDSTWTTSYQKQAWACAGRLGEWDSCLPLVFDRRNKDREEALCRKHDLIKRGKQKPLMLLALGSKSSPFPYADLLRELVTLKFGNDYRILELPQAERIYDLLAIYERADLLITVDSAPLHLAWARRTLPVFALTQDRPILWHGSSWRPNMLWFCRYRDWPVRGKEMLDAIGGITRDEVRDIVTVWNEYEQKRRARTDYHFLPVYRGACGRDSGNTLKDETRNPYLRDVIRMGIQRASKDDTEIVIQRPGVNIGAKELAGLNIITISNGAPSFAYRLAEYPEGPQFQPVVDLFCATRKWWRDTLPEIPDYVMDEPGHLWGQGLWALFKSKGAVDATGCCTYSGGDK